MTELLAVLIIAAAVYAVIRRVDVRLALILGAAALAPLGKDWTAVVVKFFSTFTAQEYLIPIGCAMGFAYVLRHTGCDQHLVQLLCEPLRHARLFLIPGAVVVGFVVNIPILSQTSAAVAIGSVLIPLLLAAGVSRVTAGAALLLGDSLGGELLNPGAPEYRTVMTATKALEAPVTSDRILAAVWPLDMLHLGIAVAVFWFLSLRAEAAYRKQQGQLESLAPETAAKQPDFRVNLLKASVPLLPLVILFMVALPEGMRVFTVPPDWLLSAKEREGGAGLYDARLIGAAMLVGVVVAALTDRKRAAGVAGAFFEGAGYALTNIVALIVAANCFGEGVRQIGLAEHVDRLIRAAPALLMPLAGFLPLGFAFVSGSGMASTQSLYEFFAAPGLALGVAPEQVGAVVSLGAAAGRTMAPVAAVTLMSARLTETEPLDLVKRVAPPLLVGITVVVLVAMVTAGGKRPAPAGTSHSSAPSKSYASLRLR